MARHYTIPDDVYLTETHEYVQMVDADIARIGISEYAAGQLGDIVFVELPEVEDSFDKGESFGSIESVKASSELYMPVSGAVLTVNDNLAEEPGAINDNPFGSGWMIEVTLSDPGEVEKLMTPQQYIKFLEESE